jgi:hypothetical protein
MEKQFALIKDSRVLNVVVVDENNLDFLNVLKEETGSEAYVECPVSIVVAIEPELLTESFMPRIGAQKVGELFYPSTWIKDEINNTWIYNIPPSAELLAESDRLRWEDSGQHWVTLPPSEGFYPEEEPVD